MEKREQTEVWLDYLGAQGRSGMSRGFLWQRIASGELRAYKVGRATRIHTDDLDDFMRRCDAATTSGSSAAASSRSHPGEEVSDQDLRK